MKTVRRASVLFAIGSAVFWMFASIIQYQGFRPIFDAPQEPAAWVVAVIGVLPLAIYSLVCLFAFRWLHRELVRQLAAKNEQREQ